MEMSAKLINYDFSVDTLITVEAPAGTDPDTLLEKAKEKLRDHPDLELRFDICFDAESGVHSELWRAFGNEENKE